MFRDSLFVFVPWLELEGCELGRAGSMASFTAMGVCVWGGGGKALLFSGASRVPVSCLGLLSVQVSQAQH